jgi:hypothetical protein
MDERDPGARGDVGEDDWQPWFGGAEAGQGDQRDGRAVQRCEERRAAIRLVGGHNSATMFPHFRKILA